MWLKNAFQRRRGSSQRRKSSYYSGAQMKVNTIKEAVEPDDEAEYM